MRDLLRDVNVDGYRLRLFDTGRTESRGKSILAYEFFRPDGFCLFDGEDFACSPMHAIDSDATLRALLTFLTLKPGDTDRDYFDNYTAEQMAFAEGEAEALQLWRIDAQEYRNHSNAEDDEPLAFLDWED